MSDQSVPPPPGDITQLLASSRDGNRDAFDRLVSLVYGHLRRIARGQLARGWRSNTVSTTALVHEAYVQLEHETGVIWQDRHHFFAIAARAMRRILVDYARRRGAQKREPGHRLVALEQGHVGLDTQTELVVAVDEALTSLAAFDARLARVVECRYFAGLTEEETAGALGTSVRTVQRDWLRARAFLLRALGATASSRPESDEPQAPGASQRTL